MYWQRNPIVVVIPVWCCPDLHTMQSNAQDSLLGFYTSSLLQENSIGMENHKMHSCQVELQYNLVGPRWFSVALSWPAAWHEYTELHSQVSISALQVYTVWCSLWCSIWCGEWRWRFSIQQSLPDSYILALAYFILYSWHIQVLFHFIPLAQEWD